jgi:ribosomal protein L35
MKTNKSLAKRIKITKTGKLKARKPGFNHFNSRQTRRKQLQGKTAIDMVLSNKAKARYFPYACSPTFVVDHCSSHHFQGRIILKQDALESNLTTTFPHPTI